MFWFIIGMIAAVAVAVWMVSGELPEVEEHRYNRETWLTHYPDGRVRVEEREY